MSTRAQKRRASAAAAKQRRQKVIAFGGLGVLAILLVIQGPKLLDAVGGSSGETAAAPLVPTGLPTAENKTPGRTLNFKAVGRDPFRLLSVANTDPKAGSVPVPEGARDPFAARGGSGGGSTVSASAPPAPARQPLPRRIVVGTPRPGVVAKRGWIVVLASIQTGAGRAYAERFAAQVRRDGLGAISVLNSSTRKPLRAGYYVVYTGPFATLSEVQRSAAHVRAFGYRTAYVREILRY